MHHQRLQYIYASPDAQKIKRKSIPFPRGLLKSSFFSFSEA